MKFNKTGQLLLVSAASLIVAFLITACGTLTVDFVFVSSSRAAGTNNYGEIDVFEINSESGFMRQIPTSPFPSGGRNPVAEAVSTDKSNLYVVNRDDNTIVQFIIGNDGKLYPQNTYNTPGVYPMAVAVSGTTLFVLDTYQPLPICSNASPCSGSVAVYPITPTSNTPPSDALGTPVANSNLNYWPLSLAGAKSADILQPTGLNVTGSVLYIAALDTTANTGYVFAFTVGTGGALTAVSGSPFAAGTSPSAVTTDSTGNYLFVTDSVKDNVLAYSIHAGQLTPVSGSPFPAGNQPSAIVADGGWLYVANAEDSNVVAYSINNGALTRLGAFATGLQPVAMGIDPNLHHFLYVANYLGNNVSGFELATDGTLINSQNSTYSSNAQPTAVAAIPHNGSTK